MRLNNFLTEVITFTLPQLTKENYVKLMFRSIAVFFLLLCLFNLFAATLDLQMWQAALSTNAVLAAFALVMYNKSLSTMFSLSPLKYYAPGALIFIGSILAGFIGSRGHFDFNNIYAQVNPWSLLLICALVPFVEEVCFRFVLTRIMARVGGYFWGGFFSVLVFSSLHLVSSLEAVFQGDFRGNPIGPFFLGISAEILHQKSGSLLPAIVFHMVCNLTPYIFLISEPRWLDWLSFLYN